MGRPHKFRRISPFDLRSQSFQPSGIENQDLSKIYLTTDELEALRLKHYLDLKQTEAAEKMGISQTTYSRVLNGAIGKITKALIEGRIIAIQDNTINESPITHTGRGFGRRKMMKIDSLQSSPQIVFNGWGCLECGFQFTLDTIKTHISEEKPNCPECKSTKTYRLVKKR